MIDAYLVVREERHIDPKYWVCLNKDDALTIAKDVTRYWVADYGPQQFPPDNDLVDNLLFVHDQEDCFRVWVQPVQVRNPGETQPTGERD